MKKLSEISEGWSHYTWDESIFNFFKATPYTYVICYIILVVCVSMCVFVRLYNITLSTVSLNLIWEKNVSKVSGIPELTPLIDLNRSKNWISGGVASKVFFIPPSFFWWKIDKFWDPQKVHLRENWNHNSFFKKTWYMGFP